MCPRRRPPAGSIGGGQGARHGCDGKKNGTLRGARLGGCERGSGGVERATHVSPSFALQRLLVGSLDAVVEETALHIGHGARRVSALKLRARCSLATDEFLSLASKVSHEKVSSEIFWTFLGPFAMDFQSFLFARAFIFFQYFLTGSS